MSSSNSLFQSPNPEAVSEMLMSRESLHKPEIKWRSNLNSSHFAVEPLFLPSSPTTATPKPSRLKLDYVELPSYSSSFNFKAQEKKTLKVSVILLKYGKI